MSVSSNAMLDKILSAPQYPSVDILVLEQVLFCLPKTKADLYGEALKLTLPNFHTLKKTEVLSHASDKSVANEITGNRKNKQRTLWVIDFHLFTPAVGMSMAGRNIPYVEFIDYRKGDTGRVSFNLRISPAREYSAEVQVSGNNMQVMREFKGVAVLSL
ncbi:MAG TPA: hypothetical protein VHP58_04455 [Alphaproteobacteria bacterium]|nr:hypothetical protein [Alphaproteobacteria bacterium]